MATRPAATAATPPGGTGAKTVLTEIGPVQLEVPRDRDASFQPKIVRKRQRRLVGTDDLVVSLIAKGLTTGEVAAHLAEIYGTEVSRQTISTITDRVLQGGLAEWQHRPLDAVYPVVFIDVINVKETHPCRQGRRLLGPGVRPAGRGRPDRGDTVLATTVHPLQLLDQALPETPHDFRLDLIVTARRSSPAAAPGGRPGSCGTTWTP